MGATESVSTGFDISNIFSTGQIIAFAVVAFLIIVIIVILKLRGKSIQLKKINIGPFEAEIDEKNQLSPLRIVLQS